MPKVGNKHFDYSPAGKRAATLYAKKTGKPVEMGKQVTKPTISITLKVTKKKKK